MFPGQEIPISLVSVIDENVTQLKMVNAVVFSVLYGDKYYTNVLASGQLTKLAYYRDTCVGAIACQLVKKEDGAIRVYITTLGVLAPYRRRGIGTRLMNHVLDLSSKEKMSEVYLHVLTGNEDAMKFYKKFGFEMMERVPNYYRNAIVIRGCCGLTKRLVVLTEQEVVEGKVVNTGKK